MVDVTNDGHTVLSPDYLARNHEKVNVSVVNGQLIVDGQVFIVVNWNDWGAKWEGDFNGVQYEAFGGGFTELKWLFGPNTGMPLRFVKGFFAKDIQEVVISRCDLVSRFDSHGRRLLVVPDLVEGPRISVKVGGVMFDAPPRQFDAFIKGDETEGGFDG